MHSPTWETHIPSDMSSATWETHIPSDMCFPTLETHIPSDMCSPTCETRIPSNMCSPTRETHIPSDMCSPTWETCIPSDICSPTWETCIPSDICRASDISRKKEQNFVVFSGANSRKNRPISRLFCREKVNICWKIGRFRGRKVKIHRKIGRFRGILAEKSQISKDFRGKFIKKSANFTGNFNRKLCQETISKKQPISLFFWGGQISLKSINFALIWPALFNVFFNRDNHLLFQQQFTREMSKC